MSDILREGVRVDKLMARLEGAFDRWLAEFEARPIRAGVKVMIAFFVLRWAYRSLR